MKKHLFGIFFLLSLCSVDAQQISLSPQAELSVITCGPGTELYSAFGHSAFRIKDPKWNLDRVYNYGTFDFNTPNFYGKFASGKLLYQLSKYDFSLFLRSYKWERRWVKTQILNLTPQEVQTVFNFLENNAKLENKDYKYDFFYDNCATKLGDVLKIALNNGITFNDSYATENYSHRDLISLYLNEKPWASFGIDLALGSVIDNNATPEEYMFLPDYVYEAFKGSTIRKNGIETPLIKKEQLILRPQKKQAETRTWSSPLLLFTGLSLFGLLITYLDFKNNKRSKWLDSLLFTITGILGVIVLLLWFATDHTATAINFNFLWAFPLNIAVVFFLAKDTHREFLRKYLVFLIALIISVPVLWLFKIQVFSVAVIPLLGLLSVRYWFLWNHLNVSST